MIVRTAHPDDAESLAEMNREFNEDSSTPEQIEARLRAGQGVETVLLAEIDDRTVGFACFQMMRSICYAQPWAELTELYVQARYRRRGLGRGLVKSAEQLARQWGATNMVVRTGVKNKTGRALYRSLGYEMQDELTLQKHLR